VRTVPMIGTDASVHALEMGSPSSERVAPSLAVEQKRRIRIAMITISAIAVALACTVLVLHSSSGSPAPVAGGCPLERLRACVRLAVQMAGCVLRRRKSRGSEAAGLDTEHTVVDASPRSVRRR